MAKEKKVVTEKKELRQFKYIDVITGLFVSILIISNIASSKITSFSIFTLDAGTILFPFSYIFDDILTEVYGYSRSRRVIWIGFLCCFLMAAIFMIVDVMPSSPDWHNQAAYDAILGLTPRIVFASLIAYFSGEFLNSFVLAKLKIKTKGKHLWTRIIGSTLVGEFFDTMLFVTIAFWGVMPFSVLTALLFSNYVFKVGVEVIFTPITYFIVNKLKKAEHEDFYDYKTDFNPFVVKEQ